MYLKEGVLRTVGILIIIILAIPIANAAPQPPHQFYGNVTINGSAAPDGSTVSAKINGVEYESGITESGQYGYNTSELFLVPIDDPDTSNTEGGEAGDVIQFYVNGSWASSYVLGSGNSTKLDISPGPNSLPIVSFTYSPTSPEEGDTVTFNDTSFDVNGSVVAWSWNFGDGNTSTERNTTNVFSAGTYNVSLTVTDNLGGMNSTTKQVEVSAVVSPTPTPTPTPTSTSTPTPGGGGGGGGGGFVTPSFEASSDYYTQQTVILKAGKTSTLSTTSRITELTGVYEVEALINEDISVTMYVSKVSTLPSGVPAPEGTEYTYFEIIFTKFGTTTEIEPSGHIKVKISKEWMTKSGAKASDIQFSKYNGIRWTGLPSEVINEDDQFYYYNIELSSFSLFAITIKQKSSIPPISFPIPSKTPETEIQLTEEVTTPKPLLTSEPQTGEPIFLYVAGGIFVVVLAILAALFTTKRKK